MELDLNKISQKIEQNEFIKNFKKELEKVLENFNKINSKGDKNMGLNNEVKLTPKEDLEFERKKFSFLQDYFKKELSTI